MLYNKILLAISVRSHKRKITIYKCEKKQAVSLGCGAKLYTKIKPRLHKGMKQIVIKERI